MIMKKIMILFAAALAALSFSSCQKEQFNETSQDGFDIDIKVADLYTGTDTKAVKSGWATGDKLLIWLDDNLQKSADIIIKYDGSKWVKDTDATVSGNAPESSSGDMMVAYIAADNLSEYNTSHVSTTAFRDFYVPFYENKVDNRNWPYKTSLVALSSSTYSFSDNKISAEISSWAFHNDIQVVVSGLNDTDEWALSCESFTYRFKFQLDHTDGSSWIMNGNVTYGDYAYGEDNADGKAFYFFSDSGLTNLYFSFSLINISSGTKYIYKTSQHSVDGDPTKLKAITIPFSSFVKTLPEGALSGEFTVNSSGKKVLFSKGNLYYTGSKWAFEANQYDYRTWPGDAACIYGEHSTNGTPSSNVGLFNWNSQANNAITEKFVKESEPSSDDTFFANTSDAVIGSRWKALSKSEWEYLFGRESNGKWGTATINSLHKGIVILPDSWTLPSSCSFTSGQGSGWTTNTYTSDQWEAMESAGAVFLPAAGDRLGKIVDETNNWGVYWSSTGLNNGGAYAVYFRDNDFLSAGFDDRSNGYSVRLVIESD